MKKRHIKYHTLQNLPPSHPEVSTKPSETYTADYEPVEQLLKRFIMSGQALPEYRGLTAAERDVLENSVDYEDLADEDIVVQKEFIDSVKASIKPNKEVKTEPTQPKAEPEKPAKEPENASN